MNIKLDAKPLGVLLAIALALAALRDASAADAPARVVHAAGVAKAVPGTRCPFLVAEPQCEARVSSASPRSHSLSSYLDESRPPEAASLRSDCVPENQSPWSRSQSRCLSRNARSHHRQPAQGRLAERAASQQTRRRVVPPDAATDSGRTTASRCQSELRAFTVGGIGQASLYVLAGQIREVNQNLLLRHPRGEVRQDVIDGHSQSADARLAATLSRLNRDDVSIVHGAGAPAGSPSSRRSHYCAVSGRADKAIE